MIVTTTPSIPGYRIKWVLGVVTGMSVRTRGFLGRMAAGIEAIVGGASSAYVTELKKARDEALSDLINSARQMGANAVVGLDFETSEVLEGFIIVTATGTAVEVEPEQAG
ncbi:YbjQ family protein [Infirmifilum sp. NZ]|uniref:YbjQ family protein n=1 Tax=Infirmifilum sp. NZ TaxID=2926850 RepID=UPI00279E5631|nr:YbjQ family protein [Infirmifilum sp. NZ]UNQ73632.1 YbjQ family protein [Infirmifilum sp. NZ]